MQSKDGRQKYMECEIVGTKNILMAAFDEARLFAAAKDDAKSIKVSGRTQTL